MTSRFTLLTLGVALLISSSTALPGIAEDKHAGHGGMNHTDHGAHDKMMAGMSASEKKQMHAHMAKMSPAERKKMMDRMGKMSRPARMKMMRDMMHGKGHGMPGHATHGGKTSAPHSVKKSGASNHKHPAPKATPPADHSNHKSSK